MSATDTTTDGPVINLINKRIRALRKKYNRMIQMEEVISQGKPINKEQEEVLRSKPSVCAQIDELEKLRQPLSIAVSDEINIATQRHHVSAESTVSNEDETLVIEDLLNLLYFGSIFDVKSQSDFTSMMLTRTHERGCCLTYDYVTDDDASDLLGERDLDLISMVGGLLISRPVDSSLSHKNALKRCIEHAKLWLSNSDRPIEADSTITYAGLRKKLTKIMGSDYFTTTPEMKAPVEVAAAAAGNYASFQVPVQVEGSVVQYLQEEADTTNVQGNETYNDQSSRVEELHKGELSFENSAAVSTETESFKPQAELGQDPSEVEFEEKQHVPCRPNLNERGVRGGNGGGRRGYSNGRGSRSSGRGGGPYQNGRNQYYDQDPGNYYPRNYYNNKGRGGRGAGGNFYNHHGTAVHTGNAPLDS